MSLINVGDKLLQGLIKSSIIGAGMRKLRKWGAQNARWTPKFGYGTGGRLRTSGTQARKGIKARPTFRSARRGYSGRSSLGFKGASRSRFRSRKSKAGVQKARILATVDQAASMDRFHERLAFQLLPTSTITDQQSITIGPLVGPAGLDMRLLKNLRETINGLGAAATADDPKRLLLFNYVRTITLHAVSTPGTQRVEVTRWRPRFDTDETPVQVLALASAGAADYKTVPHETIGSTLFDSRLWTTAYKAIKTHVVMLKPGRAKRLTFKRTFKKPKVIDYKGEFYYSLTARPSGSFVDFQFQQKAKLSEVISYRVVNQSLVSDAAGSGTAMGAPSFHVYDESTITYLRGVADNISKSSFESGFSTTPVTIAPTTRYAMSDGYHSLSNATQMQGIVVGSG